MQRIARASNRVAQIQHDNLLYVYNWVDRHRIRMMIMEWIDGYDMARLLTSDMLARIRNRVSNRRWDYINQVIVTAGPAQPRMKAGVAVAIVRDCLNALAALHRHGIVHGDIKPSNIMLKRTGIAKIVDIGSAFEMRDPPPLRTCTLAYAAPEVLENRETTPRSDLCSLGYVLIELLSGRQPFAGLRDIRDLLEAKRALPMRLHEILPEEVLRCELLCTFIRGMIGADPVRRFPSAEAAELLREGAAAFHRQLVIGNLASEYDNDIRLWLEELKELDAQDDVPSEAA
jgi:serine/threonine-protein kinase